MKHFSEKFFLPYRKNGTQEPMRTQYARETQSTRRVDDPILLFTEEALFTWEFQISV